MQCRNGHPIELLSLHASWFSQPFVHHPDMQLHAQASVFMCHAHQGTCRQHAQVKLLQQFTPQCYLDGLARFLLAARKLPHSAMARMIRTPGDQDLLAAGIQNDTHCDLQPPRIFLFRQHQGHRLSL